MVRSHCVLKLTWSLNLKTATPPLSPVSFSPFPSLHSLPSLLTLLYSPYFSHTHPPSQETTNPPPLYQLSFPRILPSPSFLSSLATCLSFLSSPSHPPTLPFLHFLLFLIYYCFSPLFLHSSKCLSLLTFSPSVPFLLLLLLSSA